MSQPALRKRDLFVLVADRNMERAIRALLSRSRSLGIRTIDAEVKRHEQQDSGCRKHGVSYLANFRREYQHALLIFDHEGCGREQIPAPDLESGLEAELETRWGDHAAAVVIEPELESWVWSDSPHVDEVLRWTGRRPHLRAWLQERGLLTQGETKPRRPKEAMETALRAVNWPRSSDLYQALAGKVSLTRCTDRAFLKFKNVLQTWFPEEQ